MKYLLLLLFVLDLTAQHKIIKISDYANPNEPSICVNPKDTSLIMAGSNLDFIYLSRDGGTNWKLIEPESEWGVHGDPCIITDTSGQFYFFHLSNYKAAGQTGWIDRIICQKFNDQNDTFNNGSHMGYCGVPDQDKEWAVICPITNNIYVTWTEFDLYRGGDGYFSRILFSKSTDQGETWSPAKKINIQEGDCLDSDQTPEGAVPAVGPNGEIYVVWSYDENLLFTRSTDQGQTWTDEKVITSQPGGWVYSIPGINRCNGLPVTKCDLSGGPNHGRIYVNWSDQRNGLGDTDIWLIYSDDGGETWSDVKKVNDDNSGNHQFLTWMDVDQKTGKLWFVWYDRRNYMNERTDVYGGVSYDGGDIIKNFRITEENFSPISSKFFGDYNNISAYDGKVMAIWCEMTAGNTSIWTADIDEDEIISSIEITGTYNELNAYPNPFAEQFYVNLKLYSKEKVDMKIYDNLGKIVSNVLTGEQFSPGEYTIELRDKFTYLDPGIYFIELNTGKEIRSIKVTYMQ